MNKKKFIDNRKFSPIEKKTGLYVHPIIFDTSRILLSQLETLGTFEQDTIIIHENKLWAFTKAAAKQILKIANISPTDERRTFLIKSSD